MGPWLAPWAPRRLFAQYAGTTLWDALPTSVPISSWHHHSCELASYAHPFFHWPDLVLFLALLSMLWAHFKTRVPTVTVWMLVMPWTQDTCDCFYLIHLSLDCDTHSLSKAGALSLFKIVFLVVCGQCPCSMLPLNDNKNKLGPGAQALRLLTVTSSCPSVVFTAFSVLTSCTLPPSHLWLLQLPTNVSVHGWWTPSFVLSDHGGLLKPRALHPWPWTRRVWNWLTQLQFLPACVFQVSTTIVSPTAHHLSTAWEIKEGGEETGKKERGGRKWRSFWGLKSGWRPRTGWCYSLGWVLKPNENSVGIPFSQGPWVFSLKASNCLDDPPTVESPLFYNKTACLNT